MTTKALAILKLIALITFCISSNLYGQSHVITAIRKYDYPLPSGMVVADIVGNQSNIEKLPDSILASSPKGYQYMAFAANSFLPNDPYLVPFYNQGNNSSLRSVFFKHLRGNKIAFILDADGDGNFLEEKIDTFPGNQPALIIRKLMLTKDGQPCPFMLPLEIRVDYQGETFQRMSIKNLLAYQIKYPLGHDTLRVDIRTHIFNMQCYLYLRTPKDTMLNFRLNEPFPFNGAYYKLTNLDLCDNTVTLERLEGSKIMGYREGFYLDMVMLRHLTDIHMMEGSTIHWGDRPYTLLHFWGEWCFYCREETPEVKALDEHLKTSKLVQMVHYPVVFKKKLLGRTLDYIRKNNLSPNQSFCISDNCPVDEIVKEQCNVCTFARVSDFPKYILLDQQGKIIFLNRKGGAEVVINKLKSLGLY